VIRSTCVHACVCVRDACSKGGKADSVKQCAGCKGRGVRVIVRQLGPGMIQQMQTQCTECNGEGSVISEKDKCAQCKGAKTLKEKKTLEVFISKGSASGEKITFRGEADEAVRVVLECELVSACVTENADVNVALANGVVVVVFFSFCTRSPTLYPAMWSWCCSNPSTAHSNATVPI
jgi:DnaJ-class molecular chaperone